MRTDSTDLRLDRLGRIVVIRLGALGDVVRTMPAVQALRTAAPQARLAWLVDDRCAAILDGAPCADELLVVPRRELRASSRNPFRWAAWWRVWRAFRRRLEAWRADAVFDFHGLFKTGVLTRSTHAPVRVGYVRGHSKEGAWRAYTVLVDAGPVRLSRFERNMALVEQFGARRPDAPPALAFSDADRRKIEAFLAPLDARRIVVLFPGASPSGRRKKWPPAKYGALADRLVDELGLVPLVVVGPGEAGLADEVRAAAHVELRVVPPLSVKELALVLGRARCYIGGDTGPMHIASIMRTPVVMIIGPCDPVISEPMPYSPFRIVEPSSGAPFKTRSTADVGVGEVFDAVRGLLDEGASWVAG
ncbi:MAG: glycosyltransferase family 9 protein [Verrucomicrobia bacterium]|nr:glycosyltransferase family 9 protein [Verrucomicrobiota bacterium]